MPVTKNKLRTDRQLEVASPVGLIAKILIVLVFTATSAYSEQISPAPILQWFESSWENIEHRTADLFEAGYGSLWTPPPGRSIYLPQGGGIGYDPRACLDVHIAVFD